MTTTSDDVVVDVVVDVVDVDDLHDDGVKVALAPITISLPVAEYALAKVPYLIALQQYVSLLLLGIM